MAVTATTRLPAGWYPDPDGGQRRRWWDGQEWTQYTADFQRDTSVDELELQQEPTSTGSRKSARGAKTAKPDRRLRRVEAAVSAPAENENTARVHVTADRLGRWLAGAVHFRPSVKKRRRHRGTR